jgi:hypothetical protein
MGERTAVGFSSRRRLAAVLGEAQQSVVMAEPALRALAAELGVSRLTVDPQLVAAQAAPIAELRPGLLLGARPAHRVHAS